MDFIHFHESQGGLCLKPVPIAFWRWGRTAKVDEKHGGFAKNEGPGIRQRQPAAASGSHRQLPEMGFGPRLGTTLPHAPGAKMT